MNILLVSGIYPPDIGGPAKFISYLGAWLATRGHHVTVLSLTDNIADEELDPQTRLKIHLISRRLHNKYFRILAVRRLLRRNRRRFDAVILNGLYLEFFLGKMGIGLSCHTYYKVVGDYYWEFLRLRGFTRMSFDGFNSNVGLFHRLVRKAFLIPFRSDAKFLVPSHNLRSVLIRWGITASRITVIENSFLIEDMAKSDLAELRAKYCSRPVANVVRIVTVARLVNWKGIDSLINIVNRRDDFYLDIVGDGPDRFRLTRLVNELGIIGRVKFWGRLDEKSTVEVLNNSNVFVLNSEYEGMSHAILEAMALCKPVIAASTSGNVELLENRCGILVEQGNESQLEIAIDMVAKDTEVREELVSRALERVRKRNSKDVIFETYEQILIN